MDLRDLVRNTIAAADERGREQARPVATVAFGDLPVTVRTDGSGRTGELPAMIRVRTAQPESDVAFIDVVGALDGHEALLPLPAKRRQSVLRANPDIYYLWCDEAGGYLTAIDRRARRGLVWFTCPDRIASWHVARPFLHAIQGFCLASPWMPIHGLAVAHEGRAVLICGMSGAGKTSMALTCTVAGWDYLGDDAVMVRAGPPRVAALYASARLREDTFRLFPTVMAISRGLSDDAGELKAEVDMAQLRPLAAPQAEICAIVVPQPDGAGPCRLAPLRRSDTVRHLTEATRQSIVGDDAATFTKLAALVAQVPSDTLSSCRDPVALTATFRRLVDGVNPLCG